MPSYHQDSRGYQPRQPRHEAWVSRIDRDDPRWQTGTLYYPETDSFEFGDGRVLSGSEFLRRYPGGNAGRLRQERLEELRTTGRIENRSRDRWGNPWPADRRLPPRRSSGGHRGSRSGGPAYEVEFPDVPEEEELQTGPLLLTQRPHWGESSRAPSRHSSRR